MDYLLVILSGYLLLVLLQTCLWVIQNRTRNASTADIGWAIGMSVLVSWYAIFFQGYGLRKLLLWAPVLVWSIRLSSHLIHRMQLEAQEDSRYLQLRKEWGSKAGLNFFLLYQVQPIFNLILTIPFLIAFQNPNPQIGFIEIMALMVWCVGIVGETVADEQLKRFKLNPSHRGKICQEGLWNYSRHPNFFFEWLMWVAYFIFVLASPYGFMGIVSPVLMLFLLIKVTGIPLMEQRALASKGEAFREYMRTTSFFVPLPKRKNV